MFSVALVLFILGIIGLMSVAARNVTDEIKTNMGFEILLTDAASDSDLVVLRHYVESQPYADKVTPHTSAEAALQWKEETGEDVEELLGVNPFSSQLEVTVKPQWANTDSIRAIGDALRANAMIDEIAMQTEMIDNVNTNISTIALSLLVVALALLVISFVLINNTVRLTVYAKRFLIHTMKLVGATPAFIRRPFIVSNLLQGLVASFVAIVLLISLWRYVASFDPAISSFISANEFLTIALAMIGVGLVICGVAAYWATNKYISLSYDEMFS